MRALLSLVLCSDILLASATAQAHPEPLCPKMVHKLAFKTPAILLENGSALPSMPALPVFAPVFIDCLDTQEQKPKWPREAVQPEQEYDATPLLAPPNTRGSC